MKERKVMVAIVIKRYLSPGSNFIGLSRLKEHLHNARFNLSSIYRLWNEGSKCISERDIKYSEIFLLKLNNISTGEKVEGNIIEHLTEQYNISGPI